LQKNASRILKNPNCLVPSEVQCLRTGKTINDSQVAKIVSGVESTPWRLADDTINWLVNYLYHERPAVVLEFGSGLSTVWLCEVLGRIHGPNGFRMLSVEQDTEELERTTRRLNGLGEFHACRVIHAPLMEARIADRPTFFYDLGGSSSDFAWLGKAEFVLVDGPFAPGPCREGTLSQACTYLRPGARFMMDDALREKELFTGVMWVKKGISVEGVLTLGEGIMIGSVP
jgi:hypothetical protein